MTSPVGIVGDFDALNHTHQATNAGLGHAGIAFEWVPTTEVRPDRPEERLARYRGIFIAPASAGSRSSGPEEAFSTRSSSSRATSSGSRTRTTPRRTRTRPVWPSRRSSAHSSGSRTR